MNEKQPTKEWLAFLQLHGGKDPGCQIIGDSMPYTCIESDSVHNACPACIRCTLKAGYLSSADRYNKIMG